MAKLIEEVIPEHLSKIDSNWFLSVKAEFDNLPFLDLDGCVSYYQDISFIETFWDEEKKKGVEEFEEKIIELDFYFPTFISNRSKIYYSLDFIFDRGFEDIDKYPAYRDQVRTISGSTVINNLYEEIVKIGDGIPNENMKKFLNQVLGVLDIEFNYLIESHDDDIYHVSLKSLNKWIQDRILLKYSKNLEIGSFLNKYPDSKLNLDLNLSQLSALSYIFLNAPFIANPKDKKKLLKLFSEEFKIKDKDSNIIDVTISKIEDQLSKVKAPSNESSGFKEIVMRIDELFKSNKPKSK